MKKIIALMLVLSLAFCFVACKKEEEKKEETPAPVEVTYTLATATISKELSGRSSKIANNFAVVIFDAAGKVVSVRFDSIESAHPTVSEGAIVLDATNLVSKVEGNYKKGQMADTWGNQAKAFENFLVGKTAADVAALDTTDAKANPVVSGCTMKNTVPLFQDLVAKAFASTLKVTFKTSESITTGCGLGGKRRNADSQ